MENLDISFEFFPPKTVEGRQNLRNTCTSLATGSPGFFSVTYGAGGSTRENTQDIVLEKKAASVFSDTPLLALLNELDIDTLIITGTSTSGCVRATVVDAACHNFFVGVVEEGCFDRFDISHKVSLMDMHAKYGRVISLAEAKEYVSTEAEPTLKVKAMTT